MRAASFSARIILESESIIIVTTSDSEVHNNLEVLSKEVRSIRTQTWMEMKGSERISNVEAGSHYHSNQLYEGLLKSKGIIR
jgi:hypothetical protein